jgi:hypothetical protein
MSENFSTISSEKTHRNYAVGLIVLIIFPMVVSYALFLYKPSLFYFRAWEYFSEIIYPHPGRPPVWTGFEKGDMSRGYFFRYQESHFTRVTTDADGFRAVPFPSNKYNILIYGDSHCFGSGLSDDETFPWRLGVLLSEPVYNAGRQTKLEHLLSKPEHRKVKIIINVLDTYHTRLPELFPGEFVIKAYQPARNDVQPVAVKRYYPYSTLFRNIKAGFDDLMSKYFFHEPQNDYLCEPEYRVPFSEDDLKTKVVIISKFSENLAEQGYTYILVLVPRRCLLYSEETDEFSKQYFPELIRRLEQKGVYAVDLQPTFLANKSQGLYFRTDSHLNARGTEIAADYVADYLNKKGIIKKLGLAAEEGAVRSRTAKSPHYVQ